MAAVALTSDAMMVFSPRSQAMLSVEGSFTPRAITGMMGASVGYSPRSQGSSPRSQVLEPARGAHVRMELTDEFEVPDECHTPRLAADQPSGEIIAVQY